MNPTEAPMLDMLIMVGGIGGTYMFLAGYCLLTGRPRQVDFTVAQGIIGGSGKPVARWTIFSDVVRQRRTEPWAC